jgi:hypothetical protein
MIIIIELRIIIAGIMQIIQNFQISVEAVLQEDWHLEIEVNITASFESPNSLLIMIPQHLIQRYRILLLSCWHYCLIFGRARFRTSPQNVTASS